MTGSEGKAQPHEIVRLPVIVQFRESAAFTETYGFTGSQGSVFLEGQQIVPRDVASDTVLVFMHPASTLNLMPLPVALAEAGFHVLSCASRYAKNDTALIMEKVVADLGAYIRHARAMLGYRNVILCGWSGGGSLAMLYQSQAEQPSITQTPAGDVYDLTRADLPPADAVMFMAAHTGRARILSEWIDPSVIDELAPDTRDAGFDLYALEGPKPPYEAAFVAEFRRRQKARVRRITDKVLEQLERLKKAGGAEVERPFIVHRTMADPRFLDPTLESNGRKPGWCYLGNPETVNTGPVGLARFSTLRAWLSQWSPDHSRADAEDCVGRIACPLLMIENGADDAVPPGHLACVFEAAKMEDKTYLRIEGATHYYREQPAQQAEVIRRIRAWLEERFSCEGIVRGKPLERAGGTS